MYLNLQCPPEGDLYKTVRNLGCDLGLLWKPLRLGARRAEADLRHFAFGGSADLEEFPFLEIPHPGDDVGRELFDHRVEIADYGVVVAPRVLQRVFNLIECALQLREALDRAQLGIRFG